MLNLNELKQVFFEEETQAQLERMKQDHERTKQELQQAKLELAKAKHEHQKQQQADNITYTTSITITFFSILASIILFIVIILKG